ncbi:TPA: DUF1381 domain-containing protein [Staphylococcus pseudintermedius]|nr:DUF1381 domain-containing protein [Staphylococcus pseudintermedius]EGQ3917394.1 DUF1381 domain-containing protein [Staphylococcus pseudintermedius]EGQ4096277.1 DUF1381 domain-containing protein [Staphylococcus pseudintermedius]EIA5748347.1 DUF1381 domain-containing protein [Staphylococcus pseudintermedius]EII6295875.1 DUF1381 domain-containing protein [Staphylococcus pseudintermedius]
MSQQEEKKGLDHQESKDILTKARENQSFEVVEAESKEEAIKKYESPKVKQQVIACNMPDWA